MDYDEVCESIHTPHEKSSDSDISNHEIAYPNKTCLYCEKPFKAASTRFSVARRFCNDKCRLKARNVRKAKKAHYLTVITCEVCGKKFPPVSHNGHTPLTCSPECKTLKKHAREKRYRDQAHQEWAEKRRKRLEFEADVVAAFKAGKTGPQVGRLFGLTEGAANKVKQKYGLHTKAALRAKQEEVDRHADLVKEMIRSGMTMIGCSRQTGLTIHAIRRICRAANIKILPFAPPKGARTSYNFPAERNAALHELWPSDKSTEEVFAALNILPGPQLTLRQYYSRAEKHGLQRPIIRSGHKTQRVTKSKLDISRPEKPRAANGTVVKFSPNPTMHKPPTINRRKAVSIDHVLPDPPSDGWMPGGALVPVNRLWKDIQMLAANDGWDLRSFIDIVPYNKSRIRQKKAPYAISDAPRRPAFKLAR